LKNLLKNKFKNSEFKNFFNIERKNTILAKIEYDFDTKIYTAVIDTHNCLEYDWEVFNFLM